MEKYSYLIVLFLFWHGCTIPGKSGHDGLSAGDCMPERKNMTLISDIKGKIESVADQLVLVADGGDSRYFVCNLPDTYKKRRIEVIFSVQTKEILPYERLIGTPGYLTEIQEINK
ncbi:MAG: hypothetical protein IPK35_14440 [Saprospiraceae bacterium]|jgi:hypothetical protein|nr:hypothetical protein [Saprospiraceae bacterium]